VDYTEDLLYYARDPRFRGVVEHPSAIAHRENPSCGDALTCSVRISERAGDSPVAPSWKEGERPPVLTPSWKEGERPPGLITQVRFEGTGCVICLASANVLAEHVEGTTIDAVLAMSRGNMVEWLSCDVGPMRMNCMMLALLTLRDALRMSS
jgi:NifU-like protein involved in Fe-S cluster formation